MLIVLYFALHLGELLQFFFNRLWLLWFLRIRVQLQLVSVSVRIAANSASALKKASPKVLQVSKPKFKEPEVEVCISY